MPMSPSLPPPAQGRDDLGHLILLAAADVAAMPWEPLRGLEGVHHKVVWQSGDTVLGFIRVDPGAVKPEHSHHGAHHHILITQGSATMLGRPFTAGAYLYIPPGTPHEVADVGPEGCTFFYTYRPVEIPPAKTPHQG
jgi:mannose-6-phosphate isomerase-like protein (cupin superfamily)